MLNMNEKMCVFLLDSHDIVATSPALHKPQEVSKVQAMVIDVVAFANPLHQWWLREIFFLDGIESFFWKKRATKKICSAYNQYTCILGEEFWMISNPRESQGSFRAYSGFKIHLGKSSQVVKKVTNLLDQSFSVNNSICCVTYHILALFHKMTQASRNLFLELKHARSQNATTWKMCPQIPHDSFGQRY